MQKASNILCLSTNLVRKVHLEKDTPPFVITHKSEQSSLTPLLIFLSFPTFTYQYNRPYLYHIFITC